MPHWLDQAVLRAVDALYSLRRYPAPSTSQWERCRIVSHRGERDDRTVLENTYAAFDPLSGSGVFGLEFDVRWSSDLVPMVFHDADLQRLYGAAERICDLRAAELTARYPQIPTLHDFVWRYAGEFHLFPELKLEPWRDPGLQDRHLMEALAPALQAGRCHVLSLFPQMFVHLPSLSPSCTIGVARANPAEISHEALGAGRAGFACHYAALDTARISTHHAVQQWVGCGFPGTRELLWREAGRGVDLVFTNQARQLERWRQEALAVPPAPGTPAPPG